MAIMIFQVFSLNSQDAKSHLDKLADTWDNSMNLSVQFEVFMQFPW